MKRACIVELVWWDGGMVMWMCYLRWVGGVQRWYLGKKPCSMGHWWPWLVCYPALTPSHHHTSYSLRQLSASHHHHAITLKPKQVVMRVDRQRRELVLDSVKPIAHIALNALFTMHDGRVHFNDFAVVEIMEPPGRHTILMNSSSQLHVIILITSCQLFTVVDGLCVQHSWIL